MAWLRKVDEGPNLVKVNVTGREQLRAKLKTMATPTRYFCQSTELIRATNPERLTRMEILLKCTQDVRSGAVGLFAMSQLILV